MKHLDEHLNDGALIRYISGRSSEGERLEIGEHTAACSSCLRRVRALLRLRDDFDTVWDAWTPEEHGRAYRCCRVAKALTEADEPLAAKALDWLRRLRESLEVSVKVLVDRAKGVTTATGEHIPQGLRLAFIPAVSGVGDPNQAAVQGHLAEARLRLSEGRVEDGVRCLEKAKKMDGLAPQSIVMDLYSGDDRTANITVDSRQQRVVIRFWPTPGKAPPGLVLLLPKSEAEPARFAALEPVTHANYLLAEYEDIADGEYWVILGPPAG